MKLRLPRRYELEKWAETFVKINVIGAAIWVVVDFWVSLGFSLGVAVHPIYILWVVLWLTLLLVCLWQELK